MRQLRIFTIACLFFLALALPLSGTEKSGTANSPPPPARPPSVNALYPNLTTGVLAWAETSKLPKGVLLRAGELAIHENELSGKIAEAPEPLRPQITKNAFFVLEQMATSGLLLTEARIELAKSNEDISRRDEQAIIQDYLGTLVKTVKVSEAEIQDFYNGSTDTLGGASLVQVRPQIEQFLLQQKQQEFIDKHIRTIGQRMKIEISTSWLKVQAALARDNPVDKARASKKPSLIDFGSTGCVPCDMMAPILDTLKKKHEDKLNVLFIHVQEEPVLANRYGVRSIPVQIFFDEHGTEVYRHVGFFPQGEIEKRLLDMGVE